METLSRSIRDKEACQRAASLLLEGLPIATYQRGVCGIWGDGRNPEGLDAIYRVKGEDRAGRPFGTLLGAEEFVKMMDGDRIADPARSLMMDAHRLGSRLGSMCFIRVPVPEPVGASLPDRLKSQGEDGGYWLQNWMPEGCRAVDALVDSISDRGIDLPVATSMNVSGEPEITTPSMGEAFCRQHDIPIFLVDQESPGRAEGSFPIMLVDEEGIHILREGHFPAGIFNLLLEGWEVDLSGYKPAKYPLVEVPPDVVGGDSPPEVLRSRLIEYLDGPPD